MMDWASHLVITPILLPLVVSASLLLFDDRRLKLKRALSLATTLALVANAIVLLHIVTTPGEGGEASPSVYLLGNWQAPFGIVLVADQLSAMMLLLGSVLGTTSLIYALARWDRSGPRFHALFLLLLMGLNGAFLTGDIFNLFVFFEVMLAASYGLVLHGSGLARTKAGLHYVAINVATSLLFLIGVSLIYAITGTLNMADLAARIPTIPASDLMLLEAGTAILGTAFVVKAGMWPVSFWLPRTYAAAAPPVAAIMAIMSKVGIYVILRVSALLFGENAGQVSDFADDWLLIGGILTIVYGTIGVLSSRSLPRLAGHYVIISSGTLLAAIGTANTAVLAAALFYLVSSTMAVSAFYLIIEPLERKDLEGLAGIDGEAIFDDEFTGLLDDENENEVGVIIPTNVAVLGGGFAFCALLLSGLPPLSGFIAKFAIIDGLVRTDNLVNGAVWTLIAVIVISGLAVLISMSRAGIDLIWTPSEKSVFALRLAELVPIGILIALCLALMLQAGAAMSFTENTAQALSRPEIYIDAVLGRPGGTQP